MRIERRREAAHRRHHLDGVALLEREIGVAREEAAVDLLDGDPQLAVVEPRADRVGAARVFLADRRAQGQILAGLERIGVGEIGGHREGDRHGARRLAAQIGDGEAVEMRRAHRRASVTLAARRLRDRRPRGGCAVAAFGSDAFEIIEGLATGLATPQALQEVEPNSEIRSTSSRGAARAGGRLLAEKGGARGRAGGRGDAVGSQLRAPLVAHEIRAPGRRKDRRDLAVREPGLLEREIGLERDHVHRRAARIGRRDHGFDAAFAIDRAPRAECRDRRS